MRGLRLLQTNPLKYDAFTEIERPNKPLSEEIYVANTDKISSEPVNENGRPEITPNEFPRDDSSDIERRSQLLPMEENLLIDPSEPSAIETINDIRADIEAIHTEHGTKKRKKADPKSWTRQINKKKRECGMEYIGRKYTSLDKFVLENKTAKSMGDRCNCKTSFTECNTVNENDRQAVFGTVWKNSGRKGSNLLRL
ncbi:hypothetical protein ElyMa_002797900 [Elysia marginata]|uniref:Uncharacterized protein n=1 Tax=Elysia marginata TaxID=1093978 RepID=A0AAV4HND7_9GAST|nr:hypothetical protein ElyMa_002797900 [Elysia marginata]